MSESEAPGKPLFRDHVVREGQMFFKFGVVGAIGFLIDVSLLTLGMRVFHQPYVVARVVSILVSMHFGFAINRMWAFRHLRSQSLTRQWLGYLAANSTGALVNYGVGLLLVQPGMIFAHIPQLAAAVGTGAGMFINFAGSRLLAFRK